MGQISFSATAGLKHTPEQVIKKLRLAEVALSEGRTVAEASRKIGVIKQTYDRIRTHRSPD